MLHDFSATFDSELLDIISVYGLKCGLNDPIPDKLLKLVIDLFIPLWTQLGNLRLATGSIEGILKHADIIALLKAAGLDTESLNNFRPVSAFQFLGKLIERVVLRRMNNHLLINESNVSNQYGYKKGHGTETILLQANNDILIACDKKTATMLLLLDLSATFDTINIEVILSILQSEIGITGSELKWLSSFLRNRTMRVKISDAYSETFVLEFGIP